MLDAIRRRKRIAQWILVLLIVPFAFFGVEHYFSSGPSQGEVATVGEKPVTVVALRNALQEEGERLRTLAGTTFDPNLTRSESFVEGVLWRLIERQLLLNEAERLGLTVLPEQIQKTLAGIAAFHKEGRFDYPTYEQVLRAQGLTPARFEALVRQDLLIERLVGAVQSEVVPPQSAPLLLAWEAEQRVVRWIERRWEAVLPEIAVKEAALHTFFSEHAHNYQQPEAVQLEYVVLDPLQVAPSGEATAADEAERQVAQKRRFQELAAQLPELAFNAVDRLEPVAQAIGAQVERTELMPVAALRLGDGTPLPGALRSALTSEAARRGENLEPVTLPDGRMVVVRVARFEAARPKSFAEARAEVERDWRRAEARQLLGQRLEALKTDTAPAWDGERRVTRLAAELPAAVVQAAFALGPGERQVVETAGGLWLIEVASVESATIAADDPRIGDFAELLAQRYGAVTYRAWLTMLQERYPVRIRREAIKGFTE